MVESRMRQDAASGQETEPAGMKTGRRRWDSRYVSAASLSISAASACAEAT